MLIDFLNDIENYLSVTIKANNTNFTNLIVNDAYSYETEIQAPQISIWVVDDNEDEKTNSYDSENESTVVLNIYCYGDAMRLGNDTKKTTANRVATILGEEVKKALDKNVYGISNKNVISSIRTSYTGALNIENSSIYVTIYRYEFKIKNNYVKIY